MRLEDDMTMTSCIVSGKDMKIGDAPKRIAKSHKEAFDRFLSC